jgi:deoxycytidylate deaminase
VPSGFYHCDETNDHLDYSLAEDRDKHHSFSEKFEIHAEMNAILDMAKRCVSPVGSTLYITTAPCKNCAKLIIVSGIQRVVYGAEYNRERILETFELDKKEDLWYEDLAGADILKIAGIQIECLSSSQS